MALKSHREVYKEAASDPYHSTYSDSLDKGWILDQADQLGKLKFECREAN